MKRNLTLFLTLILCASLAIAQKTPEKPPELTPQLDHDMQSLAFVIVNYAVVQKRYAIPKINIDQFLEIPDSHILIENVEDTCNSLWDFDQHRWQQLLLNKDPNLKAVPANHDSNVFICFTGDKPASFHAKIIRVNPTHNPGILIYVDHHLYATPRIKGLWKDPKKEQDFLRKWEDAHYDLRDILSDKSPEHAELIYHFILLSDIVFDVDRLTDDGNLKTAHDCIYKSDENEPTCASLIEGDEIDSIEAMYKASQTLRTPYVEDRTVHVGEFLPTPLQKKLRDQNSEKGIRAAIKRFAQSVIVILYPDKKQTFEKYWNKK